MVHSRRAIHLSRSTASATLLVTNVCTSTSPGNISVLLWRIGSSRSHIAGHDTAPRCRVHTAQFGLAVTVTGLFVNCFWAKVAEEFEVTPDEAYMKFKNLRTYAKNEYKKHKGKRVSWFAYDAISFILPLNGDMATGGKATARSMTSDWVLSEDESIIVKDPLMLLPKEITYKKAKTNRHQETQTTFESTKTADVNAGRSLYSGFGEHVVNKLNTYDRYTRSQVEFRISQILFDADMGLYSKDTDDPHLEKIEILNNQDDNV